MASRPVPNSAALSAEMRKTVDIEMPPLGQKTLLDANDPWTNSVPTDQNDPLMEDNSPQDGLFGGIPDKVDDEVMNAVTELNDDVPEEDDDYEEPEQEHVPVNKGKQVSGKQVSKKDAQESFRELRAAKDKSEREAYDLRLRMLEMENRQRNQPSVPDKVVEEPKFKSTIDKDSLVEGQQVIDLEEKIYNLEKAIRKQEQQSQQMSVETKIKMNFPDVEQIVSEKNVDILNEKYPSIANGIKHIPNYYDKIAAAYEAIKRLVAQETISDPRLDNDRIKTLSNAKKPRPLVSASPQQGETPLTKANEFASDRHLSDDMKAQFRKEVQYYRSR